MVQMSRQLRPARIAILDAARRLFEKKDFIAVTLEEVAREAGVSRQAVYVNFGSRAGLLVALAGHVDEIGRLQAKIAKVLESPTAVSALEALVDFRARYTLSIYPDRCRTPLRRRRGGILARLDELRHAHSRAVAQGSQKRARSRQDGPKRTRRTLFGR